MPGEAATPIDRAPPRDSSRQGNGSVRTIWFNRIAILEPLLILVLAPVVWFPRVFTLPLLLAIPAWWLMRWSVHGRPAVRTPLDAGLIALLLCLPLSLAPVVE